MLVLFIILGNSAHIGIIDAGSSSTSVYMYQFKYVSDPSTFDHVSYNGSIIYKSINHSLAEAHNNSNIMSVLDPLLSYINVSALNLGLKLKEISFLLYCTSEMGKLSVFQQKSILDDSFSYIQEHSEFSLLRNEFKILKGYEEATYAWLSVNKLMNNFNSSKTIPVFQVDGQSMKMAIEENANDPETLPFVNTITIANKKYPIFCNSWSEFGFENAVSNVHQFLFNNSIDETPCSINGSTLTTELANGMTGSFISNSNFSYCYDLFSTYVFKKGKNFSFHDSLFGDVPLPEAIKTSPTVFAIGFPEYISSFFGFHSNITVSVLKQKSLSFSMMDYETASIQYPQIPNINTSLSQQIALINILDRGFGPVSHLQFKLPSTSINPHWTLGAVLAARSPSNQNNDDNSRSIAAWVYTAVSFAFLFVMVLVGNILYPKLYMKKTQDEQLDV